MLNSIAENGVIYLRGIIAPIISIAPVIIFKIDERGILLSVNIDKEDMGRIIGKGGETAKAIRRLVRQFASINNAHIAVKINEPENS